MTLEQGLGIHRLRKPQATQTHRAGGQVDNIIKIISSKNLQGNRVSSQRTEMFLFLTPTMATMTSRANQQYDNWPSMPSFKVK